MKNPKSCTIFHSPSWYKDFKCKNFNESRSFSGNRIFAPSLIVLSLSSIFCSVALAETIPEVSVEDFLRKSSTFSTQIQNSLNHSTFIPPRAISPRDSTPFFMASSSSGIPTPIPIPTELTFKDTQLEGQIYSTFMLKGEVKEEFKLYVETSRSGDRPTTPVFEYKENGFEGNKDLLNLEKNAFLSSYQGLSVGKTGTGTLYLDQWTGKSNVDVTRFTMDLSALSSASSYAFYGNLNFSGKDVGSGGTKQDYEKRTALLRLGGEGIKGNVTFDTLANVALEFTGNNPVITGDIIVSANVGAYFANSNGTLTLGKITFANASGGILTFENSVNITGPILKPGGNSVTGSESFLTFKGVSNTIDTFYIENSVAASSPSSNIFNVVFEESTQNNIIHTVRSIGAKDDTHSNLISITFKGSGKNLIDKNIEASSASWTTMQGSNQITFEKKGGISANILASGGKNEIIFKDSDSLISGDITANTSTHGGNRTSLNSITFENGGSVSGNIAATASSNIAMKNTLDFKGETNSISGNITASQNGASNVIKTQSLDNGDASAFTFSGTMSADNEGSNTFELDSKGRYTLQATSGDILSATSGGSNKITFKQGEEVSITGDLSTNGSNSLNKITFTSNTLKSALLEGNIKMSGGKTEISANSGSLTLGKNTEKMAITAGTTSSADISSATITSIDLMGHLSTLSTAGNSGNTIAINSTGNATLSIANLDAGDSQTGGGGSGNDITLTLTTANLTIGSMSAGSNSKNSINFGGLGVIKGNISGTGENIFTLTGSETSLTLQGENSQITKLSANASNTNTLKLQASQNNVEATISTIENSENLGVVFSSDTGKSAQFNLALSAETTLKSVSVLSGIENTLNLSGNQTLKISETVNVENGKGLDFALGNGITLNLMQGMSGNGESSISIDSSSSSNSATLLGGEAINVKNIKFSGSNSTLTLKGAETNIDILSASSTISTLILDGTTSSVGAEVQNILGNNLKVSLSSGNATTDIHDQKTADISFNGGVIKSIEAKAGEYNTAVFSSNTTTILEAINPNSLSNTAKLSLQASGGDLVLKSSAETDDKINIWLERDSTLALQGTNNTIRTLIISNNETGNLTLDASYNNVEATITKITNPQSLNVKFNSVENKTTKLNLALSAETTLKSVSVLSGIENTLNLSGNQTLKISETVNVENGKGLDFALGNGITLNLMQGMSGNGESSISIDSSSSSNSATLLGGGAINVKNIILKGEHTSTLSLNSQGISAETILANAKTGNTLQGEGITATALTLGDNASTFTLQTKNAQITTFNANTLNNTLALDSSNNAVTATINTINNGDKLDVRLSSTDTTKTAQLNLALSTKTTLKSLSTKNGVGNTLTLSSGDLTILEGIKINKDQALILDIQGGSLTLANNLGDSNTGGSNGGNINLVVDKPNAGQQHSCVILKGEKNFVTNFIGKNNAIVNLAIADNDGNPLIRTSRPAKSLTITQEYSGDTTFHLYVAKNANAYQSDSITLKPSNTDTGNITFTITGNLPDLLAIQRSDNVKVGENVTSNINVSDGVKLLAGESLIGTTIIQTEVIKDSDNVYINRVKEKGNAQEYNNVASSALILNYDLFLANFNSLNKRVGELRENPHTQGVWARVFGGNMSDSFGAGSKSDYITAQTGYDYALNVGESAKNYMGVSIAYGRSWTKSNALDIILNGANSGKTIGLENISSSMVEVGIYNSYIADSGWYNDTILKFDYIMNNFTMSDNLSLESKINNFAFILSDEVGYHYKFGSEESYYIDPQIEIALGYLSASDFNRTMEDSGNTHTLSATQDSILTLRSRVGASLGKRFSAQRGFASVYVGAFYEYDYINGGKTQATNSVGASSALENLQSNGRAIVKVGSNIGLTENARLYIDVEKSFGDKQRTFMQFNLGARYSF